jgi:N-acetyl-1-D-myo-inositol-2-amino-2-deoxy-alpha-D-glucopyranoside deacetylase
MSSQQRLMLVHAHPDDETITCGATMARYASAGASVTLVTCTLGEEGEVLVPDLVHLAADQTDQLGAHRLGELDEAMRKLGVSDYRLLGGAGTYRDSGMMGTPANDTPHCFWRADLLEAASHVAAIIRELRPQVLITYDDFGGYGHPDHIQAHRVAMYGAILAESATFRPDIGEPWSMPKIYWTAFPRSAMRAGILRLRELGETEGFAAMDPDDLPFVIDDALVTTVIDGSAFADQKVAAMRAYPTQMDLTSGFFALGHELFGSEYFRLVRGGSRRPGDPLETDLFAGL